MQQPERILILAEGFWRDPHYAKTGRGVLAYGERPVVAILDSVHAGETEAGVPIVASVEEALRYEPTTALVGVVTAGGRFPPAWQELLRSAVSHGLHLENGLHVFLGDDEELSALAARHGVELRDLRRPPAGLNVPTGANLLHPAKTVLTVGSDCAIGKMTVALELDRAARARGISSRFVPTGQTGIAIAGWGIAVDAVVSDFIAGAAEQLVVEGHKRDGALLLVEGQGAVTHPAYSGVTLGLIHGSAPHAFVLCHEAGTTEVEGYPGHPLLPLTELVDLHERISLPARKARVAAIVLNTRTLDEAGAQAALAAAEAETGLVADDVVRFGSDHVLDAILALLDDQGLGPSDAEDGPDGPFRSSSA